MADITVTAAKVALVIHQESHVYDFIAAEAITAGQAVYQLSTGKVGVADANGAGKQQFRGIALKSVAAGQAVSVLKEGYVEGFTISGLNYDVPVYLSDTAGALADGAGTMSVICGRVVSLADNALSKCLYVFADWLRAWA
jgi:hypothetical protein